MNKSSIKEFLIILCFSIIINLNEIKIIIKVEREIEAFSYE